MDKLLKIILSVFILVLFCGVIIQPTYSLYSDNETSNSNTFSATTLDFSLRDTSDVVLSSPLFNVNSWVPGSSETKTFRVKKDGLADFKYQLSAVQTGGDVGLCTALQVEAKFGGTTMYSGGLLGLTTTPQTISGAGQDDWDIKVSLSDGSSALQNKTCNFNLKVRGWQTDSDGIWGLGDEEVLGSNVATGSWTVFGDVVINEIMWMGSTASGADEWIELKNTTSSDISLAGWKIENAGESGTAISLSGIISAHEYFLLSNYGTNASAISDSISANQVTTDMSLLDGGEQLTLKSNLNVTIDQTPTGAWVAGSHGTDYKSMERNNDPTTGWHTCSDSACNDTTFWDTEGNNYGTPKAANLSENDPSSPDYFAPVVTAPESTPSATPAPELNSKPSASPSATIIESTSTTPEATPSAVPVSEPSSQPSASPSAIIVEPTLPASPSGEIIQ